MKKGSSTAHAIGIGDGSVVAGSKKSWSRSFKVGELRMQRMHVFLQHWIVLAFSATFAGGNGWNILLVGSEDENERELFHFPFLFLFLFLECSFADFGTTVNFQFLGFSNVPLTG